MEFLKQILGDELYTQFESKIKEYNGLEANKDKQIKLVNSANGEYISKSEYDALNETLNALCTSGFEIDTKNKEAALNKYTFEAYADLSNEVVDTLPVQVIFDK